MTDNPRTDEFLRLYSQCQRQVYVYVRARCRSTSDADDIVQEVAKALWAKFDEYRRDQNFTRWALGIARFKCLQHREAKSLQTGGFRQELAELADDEIMSASESTLLRSDALAECVEKIEPWSRLLLTQRYSSNKSIAEIAKSQQRSESAIYKSLQKIHDALFDCIETKLDRRSS